MDTQELFSFAAPTQPGDTASPAPNWKVLSVEDNAAYQQALVYGLRGLKVQNSDVTVLTASSATMAAEMLAQHDDISVILLDVVMEEDDAGLRLVSTIREIMGNTSVRIVLLTGQPGIAPRKEVMARYDIDEYWNKTDLNIDNLRTVVASNIRSWRAHNELAKARKGLQMVIDASRSIASKQDLTSFSNTLLEEVGQIIGVNRSGIVCARHMDEQQPTAGRIIAASGEMGQKGAHCLGELLDAAPTADPELAELLQRAIQSHRHQFGEKFTVLFFETMTVDNHNYLMLMESPARPSEYHINLLKVFSEQVSSGFNNVTLLNRVTELAYQDQELALPNRNWLIRELTMMSREERGKSELVTLDLKNHVEMALAVGNDFCRSLLIELNTRLQAHEPRAYAIARIHFDSFALLFCKEKTPDDSTLLKLTSQTLMVEGIEVDIQVQIARVDLALVEDMNGEQILSLAEATMSRGKQSRQPLVTYHHGMMTSIIGRYQMLQELGQALQSNALFLAFQPKIDLASQQVVGVEALLRWQRANGQHIPPDQFIPLAEASGLIQSLDEQVLAMTLDAINQLNREGYHLPVACNATCSDLQNDDYLTMVTDAIRSGRISGSQLEIEITESEAMEDYDSIRFKLEALRELGVGVSIDDFGTGYSSLAHITQLNASSLKIDRSFVSAMSANSDGEHVVEMVLRLGERFGFQIVAEGIETEEQQRMLLEKGCTLGQGYLFAKPMPMTELLAWLKPRTSLPLSASGDHASLTVI